MKRIGIFAGTFDPIHEGHISFALASKKAFELDTIYFLVEQLPRNKQNVSDLKTRETQLKNALTKTSALKILSLKDEQFSVLDTMPKLEEMFPEESHFTLLLGSDVVTLSLPHWANLESLLPDVSFAIGIRASHNEDEVISTIDALEERYGPIDYKIIASPHPNISSSNVRV